NQEVLYNAGVHLSPADFTVMVAFGTIVVGVMVTFLINVIFGLVLALATPFLVKLVLAFRSGKRRAKFEGQLTDIIQMLIGGL
ncbi:hypothetical protein, partial [Bacillus sp. SIMBA_033]